MLKLYGKIFIGFWLATIAILASWMISLHYLQSPLVGWEEEPPEHFGPPPRHMLHVMYGLQNLPRQELEAWLKARSREIRGQVYLLDAAGNELFDREVPETVRSLAEQLEGRRRARHRNSEGLFLAHRIVRDDSGPLTAVVALERPPSRLFRALTQHLWLRLLLAVVISGLICYALSRLLTQRLKKLQLAARRLADGDLDARIAVKPQGGDETAALARDFNRMAAQLAEKIQAQKRLLRDVSHELRSPLARMRVALALAERNPDQSTAHLQRMEQEAERLDELIAQLLTVPDTALRLDDSIDLVSLLDDLRNRVGFEAEPKRLHLVFAQKPIEATVSTHGDLLRKAFENILRNALHHAPDDSTVSISLQARTNDWEIRIRDQGPGVPEAELERLFDDFYRVDEARQRDTGGYGLGLAIARRAIQQHGGIIRAENCSPGLAVVVRLPAS